MLAVLLVTALAACSSSMASQARQPSHRAAAVQPATSPPASATSAIPTVPSPAASNPPLEQVHDPLAVTGSLAGKTCHFRGTPPDQLPDPSCTPGAYDPAITAAVLCARNAQGELTYRTASYRAPDTGPHGTEEFKYDQAYPAYGVPPSTPTELDHLVSLELGGANDAANLWPEAPPSPNPKDKVEDILHEWVCTPTIPESQQQGRLESAQQAIAADWLTALQVLGVGGP